MMGGRPNIGKIVELECTGTPGGNVMGKPPYHQIPQCTRRQEMSDSVFLGVPPKNIHLEHLSEAEQHEAGVNCVAF